MAKPPPLPTDASHRWWDRNWKWFSALLAVMTVVIMAGFVLFMHGFVEASAAHQAQLANNLGARYEKGDGVPKDLEKALKLYRQAAENGNAVAAFNLGVMYDNGTLVAQDHAAANEWYRKSANQGYPSAMLNLGCNLANGDGTAVDSVEAMKWFGLARVFILQDKNSPLKPRVHDTYDELKLELTDSQLMEATTRTQAWLDANHPKDGER